MERTYCRHCGLELAASSDICPRCLTPRAGDIERAYFDASTGTALALDNPPSLRCWHCGQPIEQLQRHCFNCETDLTDRRSAATAYDVVPRANLPPPISWRREAPSVPLVNSSTPYSLDSNAAAEADIAPDDGSADLPTAPPVSNAEYADQPSDELPEAAAPLGRGDRPRNYFVRHWRGDLPLGVSFWINIFLVNVALTFLMALLVGGLGPIFTPIPVFLLFSFTILARFVVEVWQVVGTWRSAGRRMRERRAGGRRAFWSVVARIWTALLAASAVTIVVEARPYLVDSFKMAFLGDPDLDDFRIVPLPNGEALLIQGGFKYDMAAALSAALDETPNTQRIYLDSLGGRMSVAISVYDIIRAHGLDTYVIERCYSACTLAFAAGAQRRLGASGELGYHAPYVPGVPQHEVDAAAPHFVERYVRTGMSRNFIIRALSIAPSSLWRPTGQQLLAARAITSPPDREQHPTEVPTDLYLEIVFDDLIAALPLEYNPLLKLVAVDIGPGSLGMVYEMDGPALGLSKFGVQETGCLYPGFDMLAGEDVVVRTRIQTPEGELIVEGDFDPALCP